MTRHGMETEWNSPGWTEGHEDVVTSEDPILHGGRADSAPPVRRHPLTMRTRERAHALSRDRDTADTAL